MDDIEPSILYSIAITAVILGLIAIVWAIMSITVDTDYIPPPPSQCGDSCSWLDSIKESCAVDPSGVCTNYILADIRASNTDLGYFILSPVSIPYPEACYGLCIGDVSKDQSGNYICSNDTSSDPSYISCDGSTDTECNYNICLKSFKPNPGCSTYSSPVGCKDGVMYYLKSTSYDKSTSSCKCNF
jgi:hypothetical protein